MNVAFTRALRLLTTSSALHPNNQLLPALTFVAHWKDPEGNLT